MVRGRPRADAAYWWTGPNGHTAALCAACCGWWRKHAADDPWLTPLRVETIR
jgi:hypothetical protein